MTIQLNPRDEQGFHMTSTGLVMDRYLESCGKVEKAEGYENEWAAYVSAPIGQSGFIGSYVSPSAAFRAIRIYHGA